ncbi:MAG: acyl-CoA dehydrogenase [SAR324 cluster bacterium]|uniref:Acyl-CoA dehydrogenase n=1 Tax=SAR324 cluster bacterium TaxID=2024889 RepID=A0A2A4T4U0_9DELT|nr:MAG: acyl-CoA dehydrogenase [SAR324 cluster bacterium]
MEDFLLLDEFLTDEEKIIRETVGEFADRDVIPVMAESFEKGVLPENLIKKSAELGLLGATLPAKYGGSEASYTAYGLICQELERGDSGLRSFVSVQSSLCMYPIFRYGSEEQRERFLPKMATAELIGCFGLTEPDVGSNPVAMKTTAKKVDGGWLLNGAKMWITNAPIADLAVVWARTEEGIRGFIVEKEFGGFARPEIKKKMSLRASITGELVFDNCFVPDANFLPGSTRGIGAPLSCLTQARFGIAWGAIGAAIACYETAVTYTKERIQFGKPIASFQLIQKDLANMLTEITKAQLLNLRLGQLMDAGKATPDMVSMGKMNSCREAIKIARDARALLGGNGISLEFHIIRHMANLESVITYEGTDNIHTLVLGKHITGINAFE